MYCIYCQLQLDCKNDSHCHQAYKVIIALRVSISSPDFVNAFLFFYCCFSIILIEYKLAKKEQFSYQAA